MSDPEGDLIFAPILIGMAIGAAMHTGVHLATNDFSFNNCNWGAFAGSVVTGGVGGGVSSVLTSAGIGGFAGGAITGGASGLTQSFISGYINDDLTWVGIINGTLLGAGIGGTLQGLGAELDGRPFWDGSSVSYQPIAVNEEMPFVTQSGDANCVAACGEMNSQSLGIANLDQSKIRTTLGGDPNIDGLVDQNVADLIYNKGISYESFGPKSVVSETRFANLSDYTVASLKAGKTSWVTVKNPVGSLTDYHTSSVKGVYQKTVTKVNGAIAAKRSGTSFLLHNPAYTSPRYAHPTYINGAHSIFSFWKP